MVNSWIEAENHGDAAGLRALACDHPSDTVLAWIDTMEVEGQIQAQSFPDAVTEFRDEGSQIRIKVALRVRPLDDYQKQEVAEAQTHGGFFTDTYTLADEGGRMTVCDMNRLRTK